MHVRDIDELPSIDSVRKVSQGLALLDAIIQPEWEYRYFSFNSKWDDSGTEMMASMRDGSGTEYFMHFSGHGVAGKVLDPSDTLDNAKQLLVQVPDHFAGFKSEPAFRLDEATFFFWRSGEDAPWHANPRKDAYSHLGFVSRAADTYHEWAEGYYERDIDKPTLDAVFSSLAVTADQLVVLNPELSLDDLQEDLREILGER